MAPPHDRGFSLLEVLIAATLVASTIVTLIALLMRSAEQSQRTERATLAALLAQAKLEELRTAPFVFDVAGLPVTGPALSLSAANAHLVDVPGYLESLGRFGESPPAGAGPAYTRRWSVATVGGAPDTRLLVACVTQLGSRASAMRPTCSWAIRTRQP
jgi:type II secretory pathway pseudopilin PulG